MKTESLVLVVNPGSASRKYALFAGGQVRASINFEFEDGGVISKVEYADEKHTQKYNDTDLSAVSRYVLALLHEHKVMDEADAIDAIGIRVVAPSRQFMNDQLVTPAIEAALEAIQQKAPLHITTVLAEIKHLENFFPGIPVVTVSDSAFHASLPDYAWNYAVDPMLAEQYDIRRYGYHGVSIESVVRYLQSSDLLKPKTVICHLGSGSSLTAVMDGQSVDTTMGYTPLEGLVMASRSGSIDVAAALAIKRELNLTDDGLEQYLNKQSGLLGVSGSSNDIRQLLTGEAQGDERAKLALKLFVYRIQQHIGQMAASMGGIDSLVFTATIGERSSIIRERVLDGLEYLGLINDKVVNDATFEPSQPTNIAATGSKPILVASTDESTEIARRASLYLVSIGSQQG